MDFKIGKKKNINRLSGRFAELIKEHLDAGLSDTQAELAEKVGIEKTHLNNMMRGSRQLTTHNLWPFIHKRVIKVGDIYDNKAQDDVELEFWKTASVSQDVALLNDIVKLQETGYDSGDVRDIINVVTTLKKVNIDVLSLLKSVVPKN
jgi:hypothetical protein